MNKVNWLMINLHIEGMKQEQGQMMSNELRSDWKDFAATAISFLVSGAFMVFLIMPIPGFQEDLVLSGILAAIVYIIVLIVTLLALKKDEMKRFISFFKRQKSDM